MPTDDERNVRQLGFDLLEKLSKYKDMTDLDVSLEYLWDIRQILKMQLMFEIERMKDV